ncbi:MAG: HEAT repeat domain-containing protein [Deltaproteobacteria bacterium]|nr:HEAT repeat domain-containing protein [Deltaproteobacteria bacterium]
MDYPDAGPTNEELQNVKEVIASFLIGLKNYTLYPEDHDICQNAAANAATRLDGFLKKYRDLQLDVAKDQLLYKTKLVFQESAGEENLSTIFFRDGIQWLRFLEGFEFVDLKEFFRILKDSKTWNEDADGDLATAFWEANFPKFRYRAADVYWESEPLLDYSLLKTGEAENRGSAEPDEQQKSLPFAMEDSGASLWTLTSHENKKLRKMIVDEEKRDNLNDLLFIVFTFLKDQAKNKDFKFALKFLEGELREALSKGDFRFAFRLISGLWRMRRGAKKQKTWAMDDLDHFFLEVSDPEVLCVISEDFQSLDGLDSENIKLFTQFFLLLHPNAISALGPLLRKTKSLSIQQQILQIIVFMAARDIHPLEQLLKSPDEFMVQKLLSVLGQLNGKIHIQMLLKMLRHSSDSLRKQAVKELAALDDGVIKKLFDLIEDPNASIRNLVLKKLGEFRNKITEGLFLDYLEKRQFTITDQQHLLTCYRALGQCGSDNSVPYLRKSLLGRGWSLDLGSIHRHGATVALRTLGTKESEEILLKASKSFYPAVRLAYRKTLEVN